MSINFQDLMRTHLGCSRLSILFCAAALTLPSPSSASTLFFGGTDSNDASIQIAGAVQYDPAQTPNLSSTNFDTKTTTPDYILDKDVTNNNYTYSIKQFAVVSSGSPLVDLVNTSATSRDVITATTLSPPGYTSYQATNMTILGSGSYQLASSSSLSLGSTSLGNVISRVSQGPDSTGGTYNGNAFNIDETSQSFGIFYNNSVSLSTGINGTQIIARFTPNYGLSISDAEILGGFISFNFQQEIITDFHPLTSAATGLTLDHAVSGPTTRGIRRSAKYWIRISLLLFREQS